MTAESTDLEMNDEQTRKSGKRPLLVGLALALLLGGGGFHAVYSGLIPGPPGLEALKTHGDGPDPGGADGPSVSFLPLEPIVVSLASASGSRYLRFRGELELEPGREHEITALMPRIIDTLNGYLRAVSVAELEDSASLLLLRAQMLRRIQIIVGDGLVRDLLIIEFVLS